MRAVLRLALLEEAAAGPDVGDTKGKGIPNDNKRSFGCHTLLSDCSKWRQMLLEVLKKKSREVTEEAKERLNE